MRRIAPFFALLLLATAVALADPYGPPHAVTDMAPFCASCHASATPDQLKDLPPGTAARETVAGKHLARIKTDPAYQDLSQKDRELLASAVQWVDRYASVTITAPVPVLAKQAYGADRAEVQVKRNSKVEVTVVTRGGAGPVVGVSLVDGTLRFQARPITSSGFKVVGPAFIVGPDGKPQAQWAERRYRGLDMGLATVLIEGLHGDAATGRVDETRTTWVLRTPPEPGIYTIAAAFFYGTEKGQPMGTVVRDGVAMPRGGPAGASGRVMFAEPVTINVK